MYYVYLKKKILYTSNGGGQMIVWPPDFPVWGGHGPLAPQLSTPLEALSHRQNCSEQFWCGQDIKNLKLINYRIYKIAPLGLANQEALRVRTCLNEHTETRDYSIESARCSIFHSVSALYCRRLGGLDPPKL